MVAAEPADLPLDAALLVGALQSRLEAQGVHGNGHMMMLETNSDAVADMLAGWLAGRVK